MSKDQKLKDDYKIYIPIGGTLGILAHGYKGIMLWREARHNYAEQQKVKNHQKVKNEEN